MPEFKNASLSNLLPPGTIEIVDAIQTTINIISTPLEVASSTLNTAATLVTSLPVLDIAEALRALVEEFKTQFLMSGIYMLPMWDFPLRQLYYKTSYGPTQTYDKVNLGGTPFSNFLDDIARSFYDSKDVNRPLFTGSCAMFVLVTAYGDVSSINLSTEEDSVSRMFPELTDAAGVGTGIRYARWKAAWGKMRESIDYSSTGDVKELTSQFVEHFEKFTEFSDDELDSLPPPGSDIDDPYYEHTATVSITGASLQACFDDIDTIYSSSDYPNWSRVSIDKIVPPVAELIDTVLDPVIAALEVGETLKSQILDLIDSIQQRIDYLTEFLDQIDYILEQIEILISMTGFYGLFITSDNGVEGLLEKLRATPDPFNGVSMFYAGMTLLVGGQAVAPFTALFAPVAG